MKPFFQVQTLEQVWARAAAVAPLGHETVLLEEAAGRTLAAPLEAPHDLPGFSRATMDGYAVRASDTFGAGESAPAYLSLAGEVAMGEIPSLRLTPGRCARIGTGGMLPEGADAVVMVEHTRALDSETVEVSGQVAPGTHVLGPDEDARRGEVLLQAGRRLRPQDVGLLASLGVTSPRVIRRPRLGLVSTGDEIVGVEESPAPGQVRDVNRYTLQALAAEAGGEPVWLGRVADDREALRALVERGMNEASCDVVALSGGSSVGVRDLTAEVFDAFPGAEQWVHGVSVAPGKPFIWTQVGACSLLGLPGQVTSCLVAFHLFVEPLLERLQGRPARAFTRFPRLRARLTRNLPGVAGREAYLRVSLRPTPDPGGGWLAEPRFGKSGVLRTLIQSHGLVRVDRDTEGLNAQSSVEVLCFPGEILPGREDDR